MARTRALGGALKASSARGKGKGRAVADASKQRRSLFVWKARGFLWFTTFMLSVVVHTAGMSWLVRIMELVLKPWSRHHWAESLKYAELYTLLSRCSHYIFVVDPLGSNVFPPSTIRDAWQGSTSRMAVRDILCKKDVRNFNFSRGYHDLSFLALLCTSGYIPVETPYHKSSIYRHYTASPSLLSSLSPFYPTFPSKSESPLPFASSTLPPHVPSHPSPSPSLGNLR